MNRLLLAEAERLEAAAAAARVDYYRVRAARLGLRPARLLDVGCGNGYGVAAWRRHALAAFGVDRSFYRMARWIAREAPGARRVVADAAALPFRDGAFDAVISSGMIEHVGVSESSAPYRVMGHPDQRSARAEVVRELSRVAAPAGAVFVDCPNAAFPIDFWHGDRLGAFRVHGPRDVLLPSFRDLREWGIAAGRPARLLPLTGRLAFRQIRGRWWGRALAPLAAAGLRVVDGLVRLRATGLAARLYPYLAVAFLEPKSTGAERRDPSGRS
jgi:SAM-dependent methyltransferase